MLRIHKAMTTNNILQEITDRGHRLTAVRRTLVDLFICNESPIDVESIATYLDKKGLFPNKTTIYRELEFLLEQDIIHDVDFGEGKKRYEIASSHHHHLICTNCKAIEGVHIEEAGIEHEEGKLLKLKGFKVTRHMLEFFGLCKKCQ